MTRLLRYLAGALILVLMLPLATAGGARAEGVGVTTTTFKHHPEIEASIICLEDSLVVNYTASAWEGFPDDPTSRENSLVYVVLNGATILATGAFTEANGYMFSGSAALPMTVGPGDSVSVTAYAAGEWGNGYAGGQSSSVYVTAPLDPCGDEPTGLGRFTGGGHQVRVGEARVTRGLTIHCDLLLSNNLEVNWRGNQFHMTEHLTTVSCTDDPDIVQFPPAAPLDTLVGVGTGRYNNAPGFTIEFTLVDAGEPGSGVDQMAILIYETANPANVALNVPLQVISGGNLQAHYDQPHK
jgi:hypothetical protein